MIIPNRFIIAAKNVLFIRNEIITGFANQLEDVKLNDCKDEFRWFANSLLKYAHHVGLKQIFEPQFIYSGKRCIRTNPHKDTIRDFSSYELDKAYEAALFIIYKSEELNIRILGFQDKNYPSKLQNIVERPAILYARGNLSVLYDNIGVAVIGTRTPSGQAITMGSSIAKYLGQIGINVISGLAIGCDSIAHEGTLNAKGSTTAILANGLDNSSIYPKRNSKLASRILDDGGLLLSEYAVGQKSSAYTLVQRDNWQAQLSSFVIPIQTSIKGGTMNAIKWAYNHQIPIVAIRLQEYQFNRDENVEGYLNLVHRYGAIEIGDLADMKKYFSMQSISC